VLVTAAEREVSAAEAQVLRHPTRDTVDPFDLPERDRMYALATQFVENHVRIVRSGGALKSRDRSFGDETLVVSVKPIPRMPFRLVSINWAIDGASVVDVHGHRILRARLKKVGIPPREFIWCPGHGDEFDAAYFLANVCAILGLHVREPVAAVGEMGGEVNQVLGRTWMMGDRGQTALDYHIPNLILPFETGYLPGVHEGVRYWPVHDLNEAAYSLFSVACSDLAIPDLKRRWRVKMAWSWISLISVLVAFAATQLLSGAPNRKGGFSPILPDAALEWIGGVIAVLLAICIYATHRYNRMDR
jgi:hypothetical protein